LDAALLSLCRRWLLVVLSLSCSCLFLLPFFTLYESAAALLGAGVVDCIAVRSRAQEAGGSRSRMAQCRGEIVLCDGIIKFEKVPLCTPNGDVLVAAMDLEVRQKMNVCVGAGPP
jgi:hypothetical protein